MASVVFLDLASRFPQLTACAGILYLQATSTVQEEGGLRRDTGGQGTAILSDYIPVQETPA